jgi:phospholipid/cholesterol/gamma-HCH transport system ATP-binding protein
MTDATHAPEVVIEDLHKAFDGKPVLEGVNLRIDRGEMVAIVGGSGCGKTVLLKHITGHFIADKGRVWVADHESGTNGQGEAPLLEIGTASEGKLDEVRMHWAVVFQRNALLTGDVFQPGHAAA